jgi:hypothetical protein
MITDKKDEIMMDILAKMYFNLYPFINLKNILSPPTKNKKGHRHKTYDRIYKRVKAQLDALRSGCTKGI